LKLEKIPDSRSAREEFARRKARRQRNLQRLGKATVIALGLVALALFVFEMLE